MNCTTAVHAFTNGSSNIREDAVILGAGSLLTLEFSLDFTMQLLWMLFEMRGELVSSLISDLSSSSNFARRQAPGMNIGAIGPTMVNEKRNILYMKCRLMVGS